jgi:hypothetical protein
MPNAPQTKSQLALADCWHWTVDFEQNGVFGVLAL